MKLIVVGLLVCFACLETATAVGYIQNTKVEECEGGKCVQMCKYEKLRLLPGTEEINDGECRKVRCNQDFSLIVKYCAPSSTLDKCKKVKDASKIPFPECCDVCT